jgi:FMN phosphatase YigB (HAD superfamily)
MSGSPVQALLFDLGGVVMEIDWDRAFDRWARSAGMPAELIRERFRFDAPYESHERGEIDAAGYYASLRDSLRLAITHEQFDSGWKAIFVGEMAQTVALLREIGDRVPLYAFSNSNRAHQDSWSVQFAEALRVFRKVFVSSDLGVRKPERRAFERIALEIGVPSREILFFDDTLENVEGARAAGLQAVHVRSPQDVADALRPWLAAT